MGHYASYHDNEPQQRSFESLEAPPVVDHVGPAYVKGAVQGKLVMVVEDYKMDEEAATSSGPAITRGGIRKIARKPKAGINRQRVQYAAHQEAILPEQQDPADLEDEDMDFLQDIQDTALSQDDSTKNHTQIPGNQRLTLTRTTKTCKIQELVQSQGPKKSDPIRALAGKSRFNLDKILGLPLEITVGEMLDSSDTTVKELAYQMQRSTPRYRVKRSKPVETTRTSKVQSNAILYPPPVTAQAYDDDGLSEPLMITSWIQGLLDGGSLVELLNRKLIHKIRLTPRIFRDEQIKVSLANDMITTLNEYITIPVNVSGIEAVVKAWLVDVGVYDLLLGVAWMRRANCTQQYGEGRVTIMGKNH